MNWSPKALRVAQEGGCLGGEGFCLDPGSSLAPIKKLLPSDAQILQVKKIDQLKELITTGAQKIGKKIRRIGQRIKDFLKNLQPRGEES